MPNCYCAIQEIIFNQELTNCHSRNHKLIIWCFTHLRSRHPCISFEPELGSKTGLINFKSYKVAWRFNPQTIQLCHTSLKGSWEFYCTWLSYGWLMDYGRQILFLDGLCHERKTTWKSDKSLWASNNGSVDQVGQKLITKTSEVRIPEGATTRCCPACYYTWPIKTLYGFMPIHASSSRLSVPPSPCSEP